MARLIEPLARRVAARPRLVPLLLILNLVAAALTVAFLVFVATRPLGPPADPPLLILGEQQLQAEAARAGLSQGRSAPGFKAEEGGSLGLSELDGSPLDLGALSGRPVWIVFWATYCHACREEEPDLRRAYAAHRDEGLVVLAIDAGEPAEDVRRYVEERRLPWRIALDPDLTAFDAYGAIGTPTHYFVDRDGVIASRAFGRLTLDEMEAHLAQIREDSR
jgi:cytochrome c biogenesis protein CcmG/thiol:disulfide interchange protein DsbE